MNFTKHCDLPNENKINNNNRTNNNNNNSTNGGGGGSMDESCQCNYLQFSEPLYNNANKYSQRFCDTNRMGGGINGGDGDSLIQRYATHTRSLSIKYYYRPNQVNVFKLDYVAESMCIIK